MPRRGTAADPPPLSPVRNCAEWEPATGVLIRYPLGLPYQLLRDLDDDVILHVIVTSTYLASAQTNLEANGIDMDRVEFLVKPNDSIWTRDYGPWFAFDGNGELAIIDHVYNRPWRFNDNMIPVHFGDGDEGRRDLGASRGFPIHLRQVRAGDATSVARAACVQQVEAGGVCGGRRARSLAGGHEANRGTVPPLR